MALVISAHLPARHELQKHDSGPSGPGYRGVDRRRQPRQVSYLAAVVDAGLRVKYSAAGDPKGDEARRMVCDGQSKLRPEIEALVSQLMAETRNAGSQGRRAGLLDEEHTLHLMPLVGPEETLFALMMEINGNRDTIRRAAGRYRLTRRQCDVLRLILEGASASEIAERLCLSEYTVQGYVKSLLTKTGSRNRPAMVANVLDWTRDAANPSIPSAVTAAR